MTQKHSRLTKAGRAVWVTERLWKLALDLPTHRVPIDSITELDLNCWFEENHAPTCREVAMHALKISEADLAYPIILSSDGRLMDGGHRVCKALILGRTEIDAVRFVDDPEPDHVLPLDS